MQEIEGYIRRLRVPLIKPELYSYSVLIIDNVTNREKIEFVPTAPDIRTMPSRRLYGFQIFGFVNQWL